MLEGGAMITLLPKSKALKSYVIILPRILKKKHGKHKQYSKDQIVEAIDLGGLNGKYCEYAFAAYMSKNSYDSLKIETSQDYHQLRKEIAKKFFKNDPQFSIHDILLLSKLHFKTKGKDIFDPNDVSISVLGDPVQDYFDDD